MTKLKDKILFPSNVQSFVLSMASQDPWVSFFIWHPFHSVYNWFKLWKYDIYILYFICIRILNNYSTYHIHFIRPIILTFLTWCSIWKCVFMVCCPTACHHLLHEHYHNPQQQHIHVPVVTNTHTHATQLNNERQKLENCHLYVVILVQIIRKLHYFDACSS